MRACIECVGSRRQRQLEISSAWQHNMAVHAVIVQVFQTASVDLGFKLDLRQDGSEPSPKKRVCVAQGTGCGPRNRGLRWELRYFEPTSFTLKRICGERHLLSRVFAVECGPVHIGAVHVQCRKSFQYLLPVVPVLSQAWQQFSLATHDVVMGTYFDEHLAALFLKCLYADGKPVRHKRNPRRCLSGGRNRHS